MPSLPQERRRTEHRNPASRGLDRMSTEAMLRADEPRRPESGDLRSVAKFRRLRAPSTRSSAGIRKGGRLIYVGAGTSGRLAVLGRRRMSADVWRFAPILVQGLIAGGRKAVTGAVEGAEDSGRNAVRDLTSEESLARKTSSLELPRVARRPTCLSALAFARKRGRDDRSSHVEPQGPDRARRADRDRNGSRPGNRYGLDAPEGRNLAEIGLEHALHGRDGAAWGTFTTT